MSILEMILVYGSSVVFLLGIRGIAIWIDIRERHLSNKVSFILCSDELEIKNGEVLLKCEKCGSIGDALLTHLDWGIAVCRGCEGWNFIYLPNLKRGNK